MNSLARIDSHDSLYLSNKSRSELAAGIACGNRELTDLGCSTPSDLVDPNGPTIGVDVA